MDTTHLYFNIELFLLLYKLLDTTSTILESEILYNIIKINENSA